MFDRNQLNQNWIADYCRRWKIRELAVFGSALREDFRPDSDLDLLVTFAPNSSWGLLDHAQMQSELQAFVKRPVDLVSRKAVEQSTNPIRRRNILQSAQVIYVA